MAGNIASYICDVSDYEQVQVVAKQIEAQVSWARDQGHHSVLTVRSRQIGQPTILINNAGVVSGKLLLDLSEKDVTRWAGPSASLGRQLTLEKQDIWR